MNKKKEISFYTKKTLNRNIILSIITNIMNIIFPLITFPYISKTLSIDVIGKYNFIDSVLNFFSIIAMLGTNCYAIREGAKLRENKELLNKFISELFIINLITVFLSYFFMFICVENITKLNQEKYFIYLFSIQMIFYVLSINWISIIYERYIFTTLQMLIFKILYVISIYLFVKKNDDFFPYLIITIIIQSSSHIVTMIYNKQFYKLQKISIKNCIIHLKPIFIILFSSLATSIYTSSDIIMLGFMTNSYIVGIYSFSVKLYNTLKIFLSSILSVSYPRASALYGKEGFSKVVQYAYDTTMIIMLPCIIGLMFISKRLISLIGNESYLVSSFSLYVLIIALPFSIVAWLQIQLILLPSRKDFKVLKITILTAILNIILNIILIPIFKEKATAFSTLIAEFVMFITLRYYGKNIYKINLINNNIKDAIVSCTFIIFVCIIIPKFVHMNDIIVLTITICISVLIYIATLFFRNNEIVINFLRKRRFII